MKSNKIGPRVGHRDVVAATIAIAFVALVARFSAETTIARPAFSEDGKEKKAWSGRSFERQTVISPIPSASESAAGFESERAWSGRDDWEPAIAADPSSSYLYQMTTRYDGPAPCGGCPMPAIIFRRSSDSGATWSPDAFIPITKKKQNDPQIEVASNGTIYAAWLDDYTPGVKLIKSSNRGATWSTPIAFTGKGKKPNWSDRPILAISSDGKDVYVAFNASDSYVVASHDFGKTFSAAKKTNSDTRYWFHTGGVVSNGTAYFAAVDFSQDYSGDSDVNVIKSTDGGQSWTTTRVDTSRELPGCSWSPGCSFGFLGPSASVAADINGKVLLAYNAGNTPGGAERMYVRASADGGINWGPRVEVSNGSTTVNNAFPALTSGPTANDFRIIWQDDRNGSTSAWNTWYRRSSDGGATWSTTTRLSDLGSGAPYKGANGYRFPYGDYLEISVDSTGRNCIIWGEGDSYSGPGGTWYTRGQ